jgi:hypothetical protein
VALGWTSRIGLSARRGVEADGDSATDFSVNGGGSLGKVDTTYASAQAVLLFAPVASWLTEMIPASAEAARRRETEARRARSCSTGGRGGVGAQRTRHPGLRADPRPR